MSRKPIQLIVKAGFLVPQTWFVVCDDGKMFWARPEQGKELQWIPIRNVPQDDAMLA